MEQQPPKRPTNSLHSAERERWQRERELAAAMDDCKAASIKARLDQLVACADEAWRILREHLFEGSLSAFAVTETWGLVPVHVGQWGGSHADNPPDSVMVWPDGSPAPVPGWPVINDDDLRVSLLSARNSQSAISTDANTEGIGTTSASETRAIKALNDWILSHPENERANITRGMAQRYLQSIGFRAESGTRPFGRVWHKSRELAGLEPRARGGAKPKNRNLKG